MWVKWTIGSWQELQASRRGYHPPSNVDTQPHVAEHRCHRTPSMRGVVRRPVTAVDRGRWHWPAALQWRHVATGVGQRGPAISGMGGWMGDGWMMGGWKHSGWVDGWDGKLSRPRQEGEAAAQPPAQAGAGRANNQITTARDPPAATPMSALAD